MTFINQLVISVCIMVASYEFHVTYAMSIFYAKQPEIKFFPMSYDSYPKPIISI